MLQHIGSIEKIQTFCRMQEYFNNWFCHYSFFTKCKMNSPFTWAYLMKCFKSSWAWQLIFIREIIKMLASGIFSKIKELTLNSECQVVKSPGGNKKKSIGSKAEIAHWKSCIFNDSSCIKIIDPQLYNWKEHITKAFSFLKSKKEPYTEKILHADLFLKTTKTSKIMEWLVIMAPHPHNVKNILWFWLGLLL